MKAKDHRRSSYWVTAGYDYSWGDRGIDIPSPVTWQGPFVGIETTALSRFVGLSNKPVGLLLVGEGALGVFSGNGFDTFHEPTVTGGIGLTFVQSRNFSIDILIHGTYINVTPEQFGLVPAGDFRGGGEWLPGYSMILGFSR